MCVGLAVFGDCVGGTVWGSCEELCSGIVWGELFEGSYVCGASCVWGLCGWNCMVRSIHACNRHLI